MHRGQTGPGRSSPSHDGELNEMRIPYVSKRRGPRKRPSGCVAAALLLALVACGREGGSTSQPSVFTPFPTAGSAAVGRSQIVRDLDQSWAYTGSASECRDGYVSARRNQQGLQETIPSDAGSADAPLILILSVHTCDDKIVSDTDGFLRGSANLLRLADLLEDYGGRLSMQVTRRWQELEDSYQTGTLRRLHEQGSEIALHIHEEYLIPAFLGEPYTGQSGIEERVLALPDETLVAAMRTLKQDVERLSGAEVTVYTGAPFMRDALGVAAQAGLEVTSGYKNPETHLSDPRITVLNPWRPAGGTSVDLLAEHDPHGSIIFVPAGFGPAHCRDVGGIPTPFAPGGFDYATYLLRQSLRFVDAQRVNAFTLVFHPWDFEDESDFRLWRTWLDEVIQPLLDSGRVRWGTFAEAAEAYTGWETQYLGD
jgi:hypothetical protein